MTGVLAAMLGGAAKSEWTAASSGTADDLYGVAWNGSKFVAVGSNGSTAVVTTSSDGITWSATTLSNPPMRGIAWNGSVFVAASTGGSVVTSPDGVTWTTRSTGASNDWYGVHNRSSTFYAVGQGGQIYRSNDNGVTWSSETSGTTQDIYAVNADGTLAVAVGANRTILLRGEGSTWTSASSGISDGKSWFGAGRNQGVYIAVGDDYISTSSDGSTWTNYNFPGSTFYGVAGYYDTQSPATYRTFVCGAEGQIKQSTNVASWPDMATVTGAALRSVYFNSSVDVIVGAGGTILYR